ncbi:MAG: hypothetical protein P4M00_12445 [Azospirillaceae bacterium]|nr:hypothetical protein [Azospirillaceae bacterium]
MVETVNGCILAHAGIRMDARSAREFLRARWQSRNDPTLESLCRIRRVFQRLFAALRTMPVETLRRLHGDALSLEQLPALASAGAECFSSADPAAMRTEAVEAYIAWLNDGVTGPARFAGLDDNDPGPVAPQGLPAILDQQLRRHPDGWWDYLRVAFREELKNPNNIRARTAWELDAQSHLKAELGGSFSEMSARLDRVDAALDRHWALLQSLSDAFDDFAGEVLSLLHAIDGKIDDLPGKIVDLIASADPEPRHRGAAWHQLPGLPEHFFGRDTLVKELAAAVRRAYAGQDSAGLVQVIEGAGGLGKSTLAVAVGHALAPDFPVMQLVVPLRSYTGQPQSAEQARDVLLHEIYPNEPLPADDAARWTSYQSLFMQPDGTPLAGLLILDDCANEAQLRRLLPLLDLDSAEHVLTAIYPELAADGLATALAGVSASSAPVSRCRRQSERTDE